MSAGSNRFPPIGSYGFLSDCHTSALVSFEQIERISRFLRDAHVTEAGGLKPLQVFGLL